MTKTLVAFTLILATAFAALSDFDLAGTTALPAARGITLSGAVAADMLGTHVSNLGDFNGDTFLDYIVSTENDKAYIILGKTSGRSTAFDLSATLTGEAILLNVAGCGAGMTVTGVNINGDGYADAVIGCPAFDVQGSVANQGRVFVVLGRSGTTTPIAVTYAGTATATQFAIDLGANGAGGNLFGASVSSAGDIDADDKEDLLIGSPGGANTIGYAYIIRGKTYNTAGSAGATVRTGNVEIGASNAFTNSDGYLITGDNNNRIGLSVSSAGSVNGDATNDIIIGGEGVAYIVYGKPLASNVITFTAVDFANDAATEKFNKITGPAGFGASVAAAGDLNGDGKKDVLIGNPTTGKVTVVYGKTPATAGNRIVTTVLDATDATTLTAANGIIISGTVAEKFGTDLDGVGDVNNDGVDDIAVGAPASAGNGNGKVYVIYGKTSIVTFAVSALTSSTGITIAGPEDGSLFGQSVSSAGPGNLNRDSTSIEDFIVGAPSATVTPASGSARTTAGKAYEFYGQGITTSASGRLQASLLVIAGVFIALMF